MTNPATKTIELRSSELKKLVEVPEHCTQLVVPVRIAGEHEFGEVTYKPTGLHTAQGVEIWIPQTKMATH